MNDSLSPMVHRVDVDAKNASSLEEIMVTCLQRRPSGGPPARFAMELNPGQRIIEVAQMVRQELVGVNARVSPLSHLDRDVLVLELPEHSFIIDNPTTAFAAGYALTGAFDLKTAEPDLPTAFSPEAPTPHRTGATVDESVTSILPGCTVPEEPDLNARPQWALETMRIPQAWAFSRQEGRPSQGEGIIIAQIDTGITAHAELQEMTTVPGFDFLSFDQDPTDPLEGLSPGHGTATASVVISPPTLRVTGSAPAARHMALRAIESVIRITQVSVAQAIDWAVEHDATVITMSLGGLPSFALARALRRAVAADVIVLAAAGNCVGHVVWPARYPECIAVAGTNRSDIPWQGSCRGSSVDISAPGQNVLRAKITAGAASAGSDIGQGQGTSYSAALTAGVAALWLAHHGRANLIAEARARRETLQTMFRRLVQTTARRPSGWNSFEMGAGIVDAHALLQADLDWGRDREGMELVAPPAITEAVSLASLVAETIGPDTVNLEMLDWHQYGPELAHALLSQRLNAGGDAKGRPRPESLNMIIITEELTNAINNSELRAYLTID